MQDLNNINDYQASSTLLEAKILSSPALMALAKQRRLALLATVILVGKTIEKLAVVYDEIEAGAPTTGTGRIGLSKSKS